MISLWTYCLWLKIMASLDSRSWPHLVGKGLVVVVGDPVDSPSPLRFKSAFHVSWRITSTLFRCHISVSVFSTWQYCQCIGLVNRFIFFYSVTCMYFWVSGVSIELIAGMDYIHWREAGFYPCKICETCPSDFARLSFKDFQGTWY